MRICTPLSVPCNCEYYAIGGDPRPTNCLSPMYPTWDGQMLVPVKPISPFMTDSYFLKFLLELSCLTFYDRCPVNMTRIGILGNKIKSL